MKITKIFRCLVWVVVLMTAQTGYATSWPTAALNEALEPTEGAFASVLADAAVDIDAAAGPSGTLTRVLLALDQAVNDATQDLASRRVAARVAMSSDAWRALLDRSIELQFVVDIEQIEPPLPGGAWDAESAGAYLTAVKRMMGRLHRNIASGGGGTPNWTSASVRAMEQGLKWYDRAVPDRARAKVGMNTVIPATQWYDQTTYRHVLMDMIEIESDRRSIIAEAGGK
jgi:hypothetical protein